jgi:hypothetical protein
MANDFVMLKKLLFQKFNNVPIIVQNPITYFSMDETYTFINYKPFLSTTYENHIFGEIFKHMASN